MNLKKKKKDSFIPRFLNLLVVPENDIKYIAFSLKPIESRVFFKLEDTLFPYLLTLFPPWMLVQWNTTVYLFHI